MNMCSFFELNTFILLVWWKMNGKEHHHFLLSSSLCLHGISCFYLDSYFNNFFFISLFVWFLVMPVFVLLDDGSPVNKPIVLLIVLPLLCSGYDFGYLIKILSNANLPEEEVDFFEILRLYFPVIYDVKYLMKSCKNLKVFKWIRCVERLLLCWFKASHLGFRVTWTLRVGLDWLLVCRFQGGLQEVAEQLELERIGPQHQAGSDSLLTGMAFFKMREVGSSSQLEEKDFFFFFYSTQTNTNFISYL